MPAAKESINDRLASIQLALHAPKGERNDFAKFNYRSAEGILEAVKPHLNGMTLVLRDQMELVGDRIYVKATATLSDGKETIDATAWAREPLQKKGMDEAQVTGATSSYARKYALNGLFAIDDGKDADSMDNSDHVTLTQTDMDWIAAVKADPSRLQTINDPDYRAFIEEESRK